MKRWDGSSRTRHAQNESHPAEGRTGETYQEVPFLNTETNRIAASVRSATTSPIFCSLVMRRQVPASVCR